MRTDHERVYADHVRRNGREDFYRSSVVDRRGHCNATLAEKLTALRVVEHRLATGRWPATDARSLNEMAASLEMGDSRFIDCKRQRYNGQWRLHAYSSDFDLSFDDLRKTVARFHSEDGLARHSRSRVGWDSVPTGSGRSPNLRKCEQDNITVRVNGVTGPGREQLEGLLVRAQRHYERKEWPEAKAVMVSFQEKAMDSELVPGEEAARDLAWDARLMVIQIERETRHATGG